MLPSTPKCPTVSLKVVTNKSWEVEVGQYQLSTTLGHDQT